MKPKPKVCIIVATPLTIHFFFRDHIIKMSAWADVTVIYNKQLDRNVNIDDLPCKTIHVRVKRNISLMHDVAALFALWWQFRQKRFDMVVSVVPKAGLLGMVASFLAGVPARLHIFQGEVWASASGLMRCILKVADGITALLATDLMAVSLSEKVFLEEQIRPTRGRIKVLGSGSICGVDLERFRANKGLRKIQRDQLNIPKHAIVALFLGRLTHDKGVFLLAEAYQALASEFPNFYLIIAGPDEDRVSEALKASVGEVARDRLIICGYCAKPWMLTCAADFLCLLSYREGFGMVIIEAGASGIPAIGTKIHGIEDAIVDNETGMLVPVDDFPETVNCLRTFIVDADLRNSMGAAALKRVSAQFSQKEVVDAYNAAFAKILAHRTQS